MTTDFRYLNGRRATLIRNTGDYPIRPVPAGATGKLVVGDADPSQLALQLDSPHDDLAEWDNQLYISEWSDDPLSCLRLMPDSAEGTSHE